MWVALKNVASVIQKNGTVHTGQVAIVGAKVHLISVVIESQMGPVRLPWGLTLKVHSVVTITKNHRAQRSVGGLSRERSSAGVYIHSLTRTLLDSVRINETHECPRGIHGATFVRTVSDIIRTNVAPGRHSARSFKNTVTRTEFKIIRELHCRRRSQGQYGYFGPGRMPVPVAMSTEQPYVIESGYWHLAHDYCTKRPTGGILICEVRAHTFENDIRSSAAAIPPTWPGEVRFSIPDDATAGQRYLMRFVARYRMFRKAAKWKLNT